MLVSDDWAVERVSLVENNSTVEDCDADTGSPDAVSDDDEGDGTEEVSLVEVAAVG